MAKILLDKFAFHFQLLGILNRTASFYAVTSYIFITNSDKFCKMNVWWKLLKKTEYFELICKVIILRNPYRARASKRFFEKPSTYIKSVTFNTCRLKQFHWIQMASVKYTFSFLLHLSINFKLSERHEVFHRNRCYMKSLRIPRMNNCVSLTSQKLIHLICTIWIMQQLIRVYLKKVGGKKNMDALVYVYVLNILTSILLQIMSHVCYFSKFLESGKECHCSLRHCRFVTASQFKYSMPYFHFGVYYIDTWKWIIYVHAHKPAV